jgi:glycosyltransferase involved in cell wall biosynthesis
VKVVNICLIHPFPITDGGSERALEGFAKGLHRLGHTVTVGAVWISKSNLGKLRKYGNIVYLEETETDQKIARATDSNILIKHGGDMFFSTVSRKLIKLFHKHEKALRICEKALLVADSGFDAMIYAKRKRLFDSVGWWCQAILHVHPMLTTVRYYHGRAFNTLLDIISSLTPYLMKRLRVIKNLDIILSNSKWQASLLSYMVGCDVQGVIYPPINTEQFKPSKKTGQKENYFLSVGSSRDIRFQDVRRVAKATKVVRCGSEEIESTSNLGHVSLDKLTELYSKAKLTLYPTLLEQFGYVPVESMACGTPVLTYAWQGPGETVEDGRTGWLAYSTSEFQRKAIKLWKNGYDHKINKYCRERVLKNFSIEASSKKLVDILEKYG